MIVMKFGGTSVQDTDAIRRLVEIVGTRNGPRLVLVSALAKVTDHLLQIAKLSEQGLADEAKKIIEVIRDRHFKIAQDLDIVSEVENPLNHHLDNLERWSFSLSSLRESTARSKDALAASGELCSSLLVAAAIKKAFGKGEWLDARSYVQTDSQFGSAQVQFPETNARISKLKEKLQSVVMVTQGFIGSDRSGVTTTLGRGGSDYSAAIFGAALDASKIEIWTDVDGIFTTDPRIVPESRVLPRIRYLEAAEMASFGAKVLHPATISPALEKKIPVWVLNSKNPSAAGTEIIYEGQGSSSQVCGIATKKNVIMINVNSANMVGAHGFLRSVFEVFDRHRISIDLVSTSEINISLTLDPQTEAERVDRAVADLQSFATVDTQRKMAMVSIVGDGMVSSPGFVSKVFAALEGQIISMISMGASKLNLSFVCPEEKADGIIRTLHKQLF